MAIPSDGVMLTATAIFILNSVLAAGYYLWLFQRLAFKKKAQGNSRIKEAPMLMLIPLIILAAACILITIMLNPVLQFIQTALEVVLG